MSNTITAYFKGRIGVAESVYQNDYGIVMAFDSIDLPAHFDCYFSRLNQEEALPGLGADNRVTIPNSILANPGNVTIHIPLHTGEDDSEVEYVIYFKVIGRARPIDDGTPAQMTAIERALALLSQPITNIEEIVNEALSFTGETFEEMKQDLQDDFDNYTDTLEGDLATWKGGVESDFDNLDAQFQTAVSALTVDSEVQNIRVGDDGVTYTSAGDAVRTQFSNVKSAIDKMAYQVVGKNKWNSGNLRVGWYGNNQFYSNANMRSTWAIPVSEGDIVTVSYLDEHDETKLANIYGLAIMDADNTIISTPTTSGNTYTVPSGVDYVGVSVRTETYGMNVQVELTSDGTFTTYEPYTVTPILKNDVVIPEVQGARGDYDSLGDRLDALSLLEKNSVTFNLFDFSKAVDGFLNSSGETGTTPATTSSTYVTSDYIEASQGDVFIGSAKGVLIGHDNLATIGYFAEYDENKALLRYDSTNATKVVTNANTKYVRCSIRYASYNAPLKIEKNKYGLYTTYQNYGIKRNIDIPTFAFIPKYIYCAVGRTIEVYNEQVCLNADKYNIQWICDVGSALKRKFSITGTNEMLSSRTDSQLSLGQYRLFLNIYDDENNIVWQGCSIICIVSAINSAKTVIPIGDSLTNWKKWLPEVIRLSSNNISFVGTRYSGLDQDSEGNTYPSGTIHHEGRSGWSAESYLQDTSYTYDNRYDGAEGVLGTSNPFWDGDAFSLNHYLTTQEKSEPTAIQIWLGTNDIAKGIEPSVTNIMSMVNTIRTEYPSLPILVCNTIYRSDQNGYGSSSGDGYADINGASQYSYGENVKVMTLAERLTEELLSVSDAYVIPIYCSHDSKYNFGWVEKAVNPRAAQNEYVPSESVHPTAQGYYQIADVLYSAYSAIL